MRRFMRFCFSSLLSVWRSGTLLAVLLLSSGTAYCLSWATAKDVKIYQKGALGVVFEWGWPDESDTTSICKTSRCIITVGPFDPRGSYPVGGSINNPNGMRYKINVPYGTTTRGAFLEWIKVYGVSGSFLQKDMWYNPDNLENIDLTTTCFGFQTFDDNGKFHTGELIPGTSCGKIPPIDLTCNLSLGSEINLGIFSEGVNGVSKGIVGSVNCSSSATVTTSLINQPVLDGKAVEISINEIKLNNKQQNVGTGKQIPLNVVAKVNGVFNTAGLYEANVVILFSFS